MPSKHVANTDVEFKNITADQVKVGDHIYMGDEFAKNPNHRWARVTKAKKTTNTTISRVHVWISAAGQDIWLELGEAVSIQRFDT